MPSDAFSTASVLYIRDLGAHCTLVNTPSASFSLPVMSVLGGHFGITTLSGRLVLLCNGITSRSAGRMEAWGWV